MRAVTALPGVDHFAAKPGMCRRVVLAFPQTSYRVEAYLLAAERLGIELLLATDMADAATRFAQRTVVVDFANPEEGAGSIVSRGPFDGVIATSEESAVMMAQVCAELGLPHHDVEGARAAEDKCRMRERLFRAGFGAPSFRVLERDESPERIVPLVRFPCVVKPPMLSGSQGVIRANDASELRNAIARVRALLGLHRKSLGADDRFFRLLIEDYLPGDEIAVEAFMDRGSLQVICVFDKPDPLVGPFFEETIYVTPSRLPHAALARALDVTARAARALGLVHGPIHAELRVHLGEASVLEIAARTIGGLCSRVLELATGSLEELLLSHAIGSMPPCTSMSSSSPSSGVMMMPIARSGILRAVHGLEAARTVASVSDVVVSVALGQTLRALPDGSTYLGFIFARGSSPEQVERALRESFAELRFDVSPLLPIALATQPD
jgi:biotin carboxylase